MRIGIEGDNLVVQTWNHTTPDRLTGLRAQIDEMNAEPDADKFYQKMLIRTSKRTDGSGLGLARIRAEAEMAVRYDIEKAKVCITATTRISGGINP